MLQISNDMWEPEKDVKNHENTTSYHEVTSELKFSGACTCRTVYSGDPAIQNGGTTIF